MVSQRITSTHVYFWGGVLSNFHPQSFDQALWRGGPRNTFAFNEAYIMAGKALLFGSVDGFASGDRWQPSILEHILAARKPKEAKDWGRKVPGFNQAKWTEYALDIAFRGAWAKFTQNIDLAEFLLRTEERILVEGSPLDKIWGVGLAWDDPRIDDQANWLGTNWLGRVLMAVRSEMVRLDGDWTGYDPFLYHLEA